MSQFFVEISTYFALKNQMKSLNRKGKAHNFLRKIYIVAALVFKYSILEVAWTHSDEKKKFFIARLVYEYDLVAAENKYLSNCHNSFLRSTIGGKILEMVLLLWRWRKFLHRLKLMMIVNYRCQN